MLQRILGLLRASTSAAHTQLDEIRRTYSLEVVASGLASGTPSDERLSSVLAIVSAARHSSENLRAPNTRQE